MGNKESVNQSINLYNFFFFKKKFKLSKKSAEHSLLAHCDAVGNATQVAKAAKSELHYDHKVTKKVQKRLKSL